MKRIAIIIALCLPLWALGQVAQPIMQTNDLARLASGLGAPISLFQATAVTMDVTVLDGGSPYTLPAGSAYTWELWSSPTQWVMAVTNAVASGNRVTFSASVDDTSIPHGNYRYTVRAFSGSGTNLTAVVLAAGSATVNPTPYGAVAGNPPTNGIAITIQTTIVQGDALSITNVGAGILGNGREVPLVIDFDIVASKSDIESFATTDQVSAVEALIPDVSSFATTDQVAAAEGIATGALALAASAYPASNPSNFITASAITGLGTDTTARAWATSASNLATTAHSWGNHAAAGYATGMPLYVESGLGTDTTARAWAVAASNLAAAAYPRSNPSNFITASAITGLGTDTTARAWATAASNLAATAHAWGNHALAGYATGMPLYVESGLGTDTTARAWAVAASNLALEASNLAASAYPASNPSNFIRQQDVDLSVIETGLARQNLVASTPSITESNITVFMGMTDHIIALPTNGVAFVEYESDITFAMVTLSFCDDTKVTLPGGSNRLYIGSACATSLVVSVDVPLPSFEEDGGTNTIFSFRVYQYENHSALGATNDHRQMSVLVRQAERPEEPVRKVEFDSTIAAIRVDRWSDHPAVTPINVAGQDVLFGNNFSAQSTSNAFSFTYNGSPFMRFIAGTGSQTGTGETYIVSANVTASLITLQVYASFGYIPSPEYSLDASTWTAVTNFTTTYPTSLYGIVTLTFPPPTTNATAWFRSVVVADPSYDQESTIEITADNLNLLGRRLVITDTNGAATVMLSATGGLKVGTASFTADAAGNIAQDATNTATLGILRATELRASASLLTNFPASLLTTAAFQASPAMTNTLLRVPGAGRTNVLVLVDGAGNVTTQRILQVIVQ